MIETRTDLDAPDGAMPTFVVRPSHGGPHPVVLYLMDAPSVRPALMDMAWRLASTGYYVMVPYLFYRGGPFREFGMSDEDMHVRRELMESVTPTNIVGDAATLLAHAESDPAAAAGPVGVVGFCMSGGLAVSVARAFPDRVTAAASIHGAWLVRDGDDSPHRDLDRVEAELYFAWVDPDETAPPETRDEMVAAMDAAGVIHTVDVITTAVHGFAPAGPRYDRDASELHWERVHDLLRRNVPLTS